MSEMGIKSLAIFSQAELFSCTSEHFTLHLCMYVFIFLFLPAGPFKTDLCLYSLSTYLGFV